MTRIHRLLSLGACLLGVSLLSTVHASPNPKGQVPPVEFVQARLWKNMKLADFTLDGVVRTEKTKYPITLRTKGYEMVYEFKDQPMQIRVIINPENSSIERRNNSNEPWKLLSAEEKKHTILDSDIAYEDLCLDFIRWNHVRTLGTDSIKTLPAWAFEATPDGVSRYSKANYWISSEFSAFLRVDAFNSKNQIVKRVEVNGVQKIGQSYVIKEMMISNLIPGRDISASRTYIEIHTGKENSSNL
jgi:hypothetical protein